MKGRFTHDQLLDCIWIFLHNRLQMSKRLHSHVEILVRNVTHQQRQLLWDTAVGKTRFLQRIHDVFKTYTTQPIIKSLEISKQKLNSIIPGSSGRKCKSLR